jgi:DNA (cytosine-5)-methyltransferase 1
MMQPLTVVSLFSGAGGLDLGLEAAGMRTVIAIEIDSDCRATLIKNRPHWNITEVHGGDITQFTATEIREISGLKERGVDVVAGGPPCQSFSNIGNRQGVADDRGNLVHHYIRIVSDLRPRYFLFENVEGLKQHPDVVRHIKHKFESIGYAVNVGLLNAADYGVPQIRRRIIILGKHGGPMPPFPLPTHGNPELLSGLPPWRTVREAFDKIPKGRLSDSDNVHMKHSHEMQKRMSLVKPGENFHTLPNRMLPDCWKSGKHQGADTFGRLEYDKPSVTIRTSGFNPTKGRYIHPRLNRGLSTLEMAALQSFPPDYRFVGTIGSLGRQIGNAVPPLLAQRLGEAILNQSTERAADSDSTHYYAGLVRRELVAD